MQLQITEEHKPGGHASAAQTAIDEALQHFGNVDLDDIQPPVELRSWTLSEDVLRFLVSIVEQLAPSHVVEFGSGVSTQVLAWLSCRRQTPFKVTSIDHDPEFLERTRECLRLERPDAPAALLCAPLVARRFGGAFVPTYHFDPREVSENGPADLIVIDGPPQALGGRQGILYQAMDLARPGTVVLLDDADRSAEKMAVAQWQRDFGTAIRATTLPGFSKGLVALTIVKPICSKDLTDHNLAMATRELQRHIEAGTTWIVVDEGRLQLGHFADSNVLPFLERNGQYWGLPSNGRQAVEELERLRSAGAEFLAFVHWSFWWLDHYAELRQYLESRFDCTLSNDQVTIFDLRGNRE
jgi:predicted O-methyltransferase YrrM